MGNVIKFPTNCAKELNDLKQEIVYLKAELEDLKNRLFILSYNIKRLKEIRASYIEIEENEEFT